MSEKIYELSNGDDVYFYDKSIVVLFHGRRKVLSTSIYNGGCHDDYTAVYNNDAKQGEGMPCEMLADSYVEHMRLISRRLALDPEKVSGMGTAASMENAVIETMSYKELTVTAIVTGGIEINGGRAGDPGEYYRPVEKPDKFGTINIMLFLGCDMPEGTLARALVTCTEAKTAAIQELLFGSNYSAGLATGSGTDQTIIVADAESDLYLEGAGKHCKLGELIGRVVIRAVKGALEKQSGLNPQRQHDVFRRLKRFGVNLDVLWAEYDKTFGDMIKPQFLSDAETLAVQERMLVYTSLYIHILDQREWKLLQEEESVSAANEMLGFLAQYYGTETENVPGAGIAEMMAAWRNVFNKIIHGRKYGKKVE